MDPENVRTVVTGVVTLTVGVVPAYLLYRQNTKSAEREAASREAERQAEERRETQALERERLSHGEESEARAAREYRERFVRFLRIVAQIDTGVHAAFASGHMYKLPDQERAELASSYEDLLIGVDADTRDAVTFVRDALTRVIERADSTEALLRAARDDLDGALTELRERAVIQFGGSTESRQS